MGLLISIFQAATSLNETTLSFVPKIIAMFLTLIFAGPWMLQVMTDYIQRLYSSIPSLIGMISFTSAELNAWIALSFFLWSVSWPLSLRPPSSITLRCPAGYA